MDVHDQSLTVHIPRPVVPLVYIKPAATQHPISESGFNPTSRTSERKIRDNGPATSSQLDTASVLIGTVDVLNAVDRRRGWSETVVQRRSKMASVERWQGNRWRARWRAPDGRQRSRVFDRKADATRFLTTVEVGRITGTYVDPRAGRVTFRDYAEDWRSRQLWRESSMDRIESLLRNHLYPVLGCVPLDTIRPSDLDRLVKGLSETLAPSTVVGAYRLAASVFKAAVRDRVLGSSPCVDVRLPVRAQREVVPLTPRQVVAVADAIPHRYRALVVLGAGCGLRLGEATGLTVDRVDFLRRTVKIDRQLITPTRGAPRLGPPKRPASNRVVPLPSVVAVELAAHLKRFDPGTDGLIFTTARGLPVRRNTFGETFRRAASSAGVSLPDWGGYHELRHHYASLLIASGCSVVVVQRRLGHANAEETLNTYSHLWPDDDQRTVDAVDRSLGAALSSRVSTWEQKMDA